jgi:hypothetical protein
MLLGLFLGLIGLFLDFMKVIIISFIKPFEGII